MNLTYQEMKPSNITLMALISKNTRRNFESSNQMRSLLIDPGSNIAQEDDFDLIDDPDVCKRCFFSKVFVPNFKRRHKCLLNQKNNVVCSVCEKSFA